MLPVMVAKPMVSTAKVFISSKIPASATLGFFPAAPVLSSRAAVAIGSKLVAAAKPVAAILMKSRRELPTCSLDILLPLGWLALVISSAVAAVGRRWQAGCSGSLESHHGRFPAKRPMWAPSALVPQPGRESHFRPAEDLHSKHLGFPGARHVCGAANEPWRERERSQLACQSRSQLGPIWLQPAIAAHAKIAPPARRRAPGVASFAA